MSGEKDGFAMQEEKAIDFIRPIEIGNTIIPNNIFLAPMAGGSELPFRRICRRMGAGLVFTELVTARGIRFQKGVEKNYRYLEISPDEFPVAIQLFGADPLDFEAAIHIILEHPLLSKCAMIDINMGCPVPKVIKTGAGCALMKNLSVASQIIESSVKASSVPISVKFRKGWNSQSANAAQFAKMCEDSGAAMLTIHGRTADQMYSGKADWNAIRDVKNAVKIPVIGNGDVDSPASAREMFATTNVDGVMIGRAALGNPWIFTRILTDSEHAWQPPDMNERTAVMKEHLAGSIGQMGEITAIKEMRKHFAWYLKGIPGSADIKNQLMHCISEKEILQVISFLQ
ncbi:MAG: tRNA dihydrouridine synthase DusB [Saccharofermentanales bacterium]